MRAAHNHCTALSTEMVSVFNSIRCRTVTVTPQLQNQQDKLLRLLERFSPVRNRYPVLLFLVGSLMILTPGNFKYRELFGKLVPLNPAEKSELWYKNQWWLETIDVAPDWSHRDDSLPATTKHYWIKTKSWHAALLTEFLIRISHQQAMSHYNANLDM